MSSDKDSIQTEWNQSKATHKRLDTLFSLLHEHALTHDWSSCKSILYRLLAEASSVLTEDEYDTCEEKIEACSNWDRKVNQEDTQKKFLDAEKTIRMKLQEHGMMIAEQPENNTGRM